MNPSKIHWEACQQDFEPDGALRDIFIYGTTIEHWRTLYHVLRATYRLEYSVDNKPQPLPASVDEALAGRSTSSPMLRFRVGSTMVVCHFFTTDEIEMDIDPREIRAQEALDELLNFLQLVGDSVGRTVSLSYEGDDQHPFIKYEPRRNDFQYHKYGA